MAFSTSACSASTTTRSVVQEKNKIFSIIFAKKNDEIEELTGCQRGTANWE